MMQLRTGHTEGPSGPSTTCSSRKYGDSTSLKSPMQIILAKVEAARARHQPRVNEGRRLMTMSDTRGSVIYGVCQHDPERWREFNAIYRPMLLAFLRKQGLNDSDASDVVGDIFVKLLDKIQTYDREKCPFRSWLFSVAHNALIDFARRRATQRKALEGWVLTVLHATPSDSVRMAEEWVKMHRTKILHHALKTVRNRTSAKTWACFEQRLLRDRPGAEIGAELGLEASTVFVNASRVLKRVRTLCQEFDEDLINDDDSSLSRRD
jgi:RNA polymerase sigma factor (sigma-70 family)